MRFFLDYRSFLALTVASSATSILVSLLFLHQAASALAMIQVPGVQAACRLAKEVRYSMAVVSL
jgi:hypothetical protein